LLLLGHIGRGVSLAGSVRASATATCMLRVTTTTDTEEAERKLLASIDLLGGKEVKNERIQSFYWWEGKVQNDEERRLSFSVDKPFSDVLEQVGSAHNYDVPMIIADSVGEETPYWKGELTPAEGGGQLAESLAASRLVACAQVAPDGALAVKTTAKAKAAVDKLAPSISWTPILGNKPYVDWLDAETREAAAKACEQP
jgi:uncharacterized protein involved in tolerance to divalent cations